MNVAILYICTGEYSIFWEDFYTSAKLNLLIKHNKHFFVFTDNLELHNRKNYNDTTFIQQKKMGWPFDTLYRYKFFLRINDTLEKYDYVYYINANALIVGEVGDEIFPTPSLLIGSQHPCFFDKKPDEFIYERNPDSLAYIEKGKGNHYVMGAFIGGEAIAFMQMCKQLNDNIDSDYQNNIIALWHDESHYNRFILDCSYKLLSPSYVYPEEMEIPFQPKIILRDKTKYGGHNLLRGIKTKSSFSYFVKRIFLKLINKKPFIKI